MKDKRHIKSFNEHQENLNISDVISRLEQKEIIEKAVKKFGDLNAVSKWCGVPVWLLQNVLNGNEIRQTQYDKMVWMKKRINDL
jgi:hypothetical protein